MGANEGLEQCRVHVESLLRDRGHSGLRKTSYPSGSLGFLEQCDGVVTIVDEIRKAQAQLNVIVVGAGLGGLATAIALRRRGHQVTVFERAPKLDEVGAGIQIPPNATRILLKFGLGSHLLQHATRPDSIRFRRWETGEVIGCTKLIPEFETRFGAPYYVMHRANLQLSLYQVALELGVSVFLNAGVKIFDQKTPSIQLDDGTIHKADLIVAADGIKSEARRVVLGGSDQPPRKAGFAAYRAMVEVEKMSGDAELEELLRIPGQNLWVGNQRHVMTYTVAGGKYFNMVLSHPEDEDPGDWNQKTVIEDMKANFQGWDPCLVKVIDLIEKTQKWPLLTGTPLPRWVSSSGKLLIIGDAAHAMVPYMSAGAAMAVEDGAALAEVLSLIGTTKEMQRALEIFQTVRMSRTGQMQEASLVNGKIWHFEDGPEQRARDESMKNDCGGDGIRSSANQWSDAETSRWAYGYDAEEQVRRAWIEDAKQRRPGSNL